MEPSEYLTVTALTAYIKRKFDNDPYLGKIYLTGEISNFRLRRNAHQYFSLKDDHAKISAIMFKSAFSKIKFMPEEGMKVLVTGRISLYEPSGSYQIYVDHMEPDGVGQFYQAYEQLKKKLAEEGLFNASKKPLPRFPKRIAVVTSPSGSVIRDIITTTRRRYPIAQIVLFPALVQGTEAAPDIVRQINRANSIGGFDTLIIGRGGGSIEDLWPFNEETVARAIFASQIPVISSVGHETDTTIADLVADVRAATPTAAGELAVPVLSDVLLEIGRDRVRLLNAFRHELSLLQERLTKLRQTYVFEQPERLYEGYSQKVDQLSRQLEQTMTHRVTLTQTQLTADHDRLMAATPATQVAQLTQTTHDLQARLNRGAQQTLLNHQQHLGQLAQSLDFLSPLKVMGRGYSYVTSDDKVLASTADLAVNETVTMHFKDGQATAEIKTIKTTDKD
ncbi:exodeoxyribonuclease VII large subunit [Secundilactobacillus paracollinoides]|uniref:Exodeoxyribonuclease 7 large subunit n=1 Tax=Secundilactobacillus paracollinoides TaxID=240427 RepID=A0A1B2J186_9LACO|nr:exodeoxyribonuclease VII large subunit [Secundilactobacillus paracollinoides]ANZ62138.1 exodeoxyribonuclease VII large subunit [Secundilactobacillus paracollinoides]ANZ63827.1 exodeoxyribonuclease VII large subunit [Secundilactobacillus paracollinoides]ANZ68085.1 exodeoxyribonuclease VII large subunit [Secundilactobacillus paracollinoides]